MINIYRLCICFYVFDNKNILYYVIEIKKGFIVYIFCRKIVVKFLFIMFFFKEKKNLDLYKIEFCYYMDYYIKIYVLFIFFE